MNATMKEQQQDPLVTLRFLTDYLESTQKAMNLGLISPDAALLVTSELTSKARELKYEEAV